MKLYRVTFTHYAPKGHHEGVESIVCAPSEAAVFNHLDAVTYGRWTEDQDEDAEDDEWSPSSEKPLSDADLARVADLGLSITTEPWGITLVGPRGAMVRFHRGDHYRDVEDAYYGATQYAWEEIAGEYDEATVRLVMGDRFIVVGADGKAVTA